MDRENRLRPRRDALRDVIRGSMFQVSGSMSAKTGVAPAYRMALAVAMNEYEGQITSSPGPIAGDDEREMQRRGARRRRDGVARADALGEQLLELRDLRSLADPAAREHLGDGARLGLVELRPGEWDLVNGGVHWLGRDRSSLPPGDEARSPSSSDTLRAETELLAAPRRRRRAAAHRVDLARRRRARA